MYEIQQFHTKFANTENFADHDRTQEIWRTKIGYWSTETIRGPETNDAPIEVFRFSTRVITDTNTPGASVDGGFSVMAVWNDGEAWVVTDQTNFPPDESGRCEPVHVARYSDLDDAMLEIQHWIYGALHAAIYGSANGPLTFKQYVERNMTEELLADAGFYQERWGMELCEEGRDDAPIERAMSEIFKNTQWSK